MATFWPSIAIGLGFLKVLRTLGFLKRLDMQIVDTFDELVAVGVVGLYLQEPPPLNLFFSSFLLYRAFVNKLSYFFFENTGIVS